MIPGCVPELLAYTGDRFSAFNNNNAIVTMPECTPDQIAYIGDSYQEYKWHLDDPRMHTRSQKLTNDTNCITMAPESMRKTWPKITDGRLNIE